MSKLADLNYQMIHDFDDSDYEVSHPEPTGEKCPNKDCTGYLLKEPVSTSPDDFTMTWVCPVCGDTWS